MTLFELVTLLFQELKNLPEEKAHKLMAPYKRQSEKPIQNTSVNPKLSAVLMLLYEKKNTLLCTYSTDRL